MPDSDGGRLSVSLLESREGREDDLCAVWREFETLFVRKGYGHVELIRDEGRGSRFYAVHYWTDKTAVRRFGIDKEARVALRKLFRTARATPLLTGVNRTGNVGDRIR